MPGEKLTNTEKPDSGKDAPKVNPNLDNASSAENRKLITQFQIDYGAKIKGNTMEVTTKQGDVEYKYVLTTNRDGTVTISKFNESERKEKGSTLPTKATVTYARLYADSVVAMPELGRILAENKNVVAAPSPKEKTPTPTQPPKKEARLVRPGVSTDAPPVDSKDDHHDEEYHPHTGAVEAGVMIPQMKTTKDSQSIVDSNKFGAMLGGHLNLIDRSKGYVALTGTGHVEWGDSTTLSTGAAADKIKDSSFVTVGFGAGLEAGFKPVRPVSLFVGGGVKGEVSFVEYTNVTQGAKLNVDDGTKTKFAPGAFVAAGLRVNPVSRLTIGASVEPTFILGHSPTVPVFATAGWFF